MNYLVKEYIKTIKINKITKYNIYTPKFSSLFFSFLSPLFNLALEKTKNYKFRHTKLNYQSISRSHKRNTSFSNTNKNLIDYSLNNVCSLEVTE